MSQKIANVTPGDYAILIGSGAFGVFGNSEMTGGGTDAPRSSYFYANVATNTWYNGSFSGTQFVVEGNVVPIPAALPLLLSALGVFGFFGWRRKRMAADRTNFSGGQVPDRQIRREITLWEASEGLRSFRPSRTTDWTQCRWSNQISAQSYDSSGFDVALKGSRVRVHQMRSSFWRYE